MNAYSRRAGDTVRGLRIDALLRVSVVSALADEVARLTRYVRVAETKQIVGGAG